MSNAQLVEWESAARAAADQLCGINDRVSDDFALNTVPVEVADGTNLLDHKFVAKLERCEHLTDAFLAYAE